MNPVLFCMISALFLSIPVLSNYCSSDELNYSLNKLYGTNPVNLICNSNQWQLGTSSWSYLSDGSSNPAVLSTKDNRHTINYINGSDEGLYWCNISDDVTECFNITVQGMLQFKGCPDPLNGISTCNSGKLHMFEAGQTITFNISFQFYGGGNRGAVQDRGDISVYRKSNELPNSKWIVYCYDISHIGDKCLVGPDEKGERINFNYYNNNRDIQVSISNAEVNDTGNYTVVVSQTSGDLTSYFSISVTTASLNSFTSTTVATSVPVSVPTVTHALSSSTSNGVYTAHSFPLATPATQSLRDHSYSTSSQPLVFATVTGIPPSPMSLSSVTPSSLYSSLTRPHTHHTLAPTSERSMTTDKATIVGTILAGVVVVIGAIFGIIFTVACIAKANNSSCTKCRIFSSSAKLFPTKDKIYSVTNSCTFSDKTCSLSSIRIDAEPVYDRPLAHNVDTLSNEHNSRQVTV